MKQLRKLIEVALPLEAINKASAREKSIRHGHPSTMHLWWARRPLAAARAVIFAQMVDDPSGYVDTLKSDPKLRRQAEELLRARHKLWAEATALLKKAKEAGISAPEPGPEPMLDAILAENERQRLFRIIEELVLWENTSNEEVLKKARAEIWQSWRRTCADNAGHPLVHKLFDREKLPAFHDPFAGGGGLPLEAQRLGLEAHASDLNPVAVLINKAMIEIPPMFAGQPPVNAEARKGQLGTKTWRSAQGIAEDVRYYGQWMRDEAERRIGHLYPKIEITAAMARERPDLKSLTGQKLTVITWIWARTVKSPNPAFRRVDVPLASTFMLSTKPGREAWIEPVIEDGGYRLMVRVGKPKNAEAAESGTKPSRGSNFLCLVSGTPIEQEYIMAEAKAERLGSKLLAVLAEGDSGRIYLSPTEIMESAAQACKPDWTPDIEFFTEALGFRIGNYGMTKWSDLFTARQLIALSTFSSLVTEAAEKVKKDAIARGMGADVRRLCDGGTGAIGYADAVAVYLALGVGRSANYWSALTKWGGEFIVQTFGRQALSMVWDFAEGNPFSSSTGNWTGALEWIEKVLIDALPAAPHGFASASDAQTQSISASKVVSTDPPYYDNIGYADLSDFFYVWLRHTLATVLPNLMVTMVTPKAEELVATPARHGGRQKAERFFLNGMTMAMGRLSIQTHPAFPVTIYYAFKQSESEGSDGIASTGWETFLDAVVRSGFAVSGTWPMRTERSGGFRNRARSSLASSIVLVCRPRAADAPKATRREFVAALQRELPDALRHLQAGNIAPVDLAQAAIGPGMAVFTRYAQVLDAQGHGMRVREALALINETLDTALAEQEGDFDPDSRWALTWFEQMGFEEGEFGEAEKLSKAKNTSVRGLEEAGILVSKRGKVRLLKPDDLPSDWDPATDARLTGWEAVQHLVRALGSGGESAAAAIVAKLGTKAETARELAYRLYTVCERKKRAGEALAYNGLVQSWPELVRLAQEDTKGSPTSQITMFAEPEE